MVFVHWDLWMRHDNYDNYPENLIIVCFIYLICGDFHCENACDES